MRTTGAFLYGPTPDPPQAAKVAARTSRTERRPAPKLASVEDLPEAEGGVEHRALVLAAPGLRRGPADAVGQPRQRQRLQPHLAGPGERREEESLAAEQGGFHLADELDVVAHARLQRDQAARVDA